MKCKRMIAKIIIIFSFIFFVILIISNSFLVRKKYDLEFDNLPNNFNKFRIVLLSDLHSIQFGKNNKILINSIKRQKPNIILLAKDIIGSTDVDFSIFLDLVENISQQYKTFYIVGNHEQKLEDLEIENLFYELENRGVKILDNEYVTLKKGNESIYLYGLWFNLRYYSDLNEGYIKEEPERYYFNLDKINELIQPKKSDDFTVLLTHNPIYFNTYVDWGADLTLAGHMHGGMIRLPIIGGVFSPDKTFFPEYDKGNYAIEDRQMIVSAGLGIGKKGIRFLNCPEIVTIVLHTKD